MKKELHFHLIHYLVLILILGLGVLLFLFFSIDKGTQFLVGIIISLLYFVWGVSHHYLEGDLHPAIVVEYLLIALLAIFLVRGAIFH